MLLLLLRKSYICILLLIAHCSLLTVKSQNASKLKNWSFNGYVKNLSSAMIIDINENWYLSNLIHNRLNFKYYINKKFTLAIENRNRIFFSEMMKDNPGYAESYEADDGLIKLSHNFLNKNSFIINSNIDRAYIDFSKDKFQLTLGRQRINWGQTFVWNPNDIFNSYSYFDFDYEEKPGSDALRLQYYTASADKAEISIKADYNKDITAAALYKFNRWSYDLQCLAGIMNSQDIAFGTGWAGQIAKGGFRGEMTYFIPLRNSNHKDAVLIGSIGYDYTFNNSLLLQAEFLYNGNDKQSAFDIEQISIIGGNMNSSDAMSARNPFLSGFSQFASVSYPLTPLLNASLAGIYNPDNRLIFFIPMLSLSMLKNLDASLISQSFFAFSKNNALQNGGIIFLRLKWSF